MVNFIVSFFKKLFCCHKRVGHIFFPQVVNKYTSLGYDEDWCMDCGKEL